MNVLLLSMPDSFEHMPSIAIRMPNGALASLAGNVDAHHHVAIADLILVQSSVRSTVERLVHGLEPDVVGLSVGDRPPLDFPATRTQQSAVVRGFCRSL